MSFLQLHFGATLAAALAIVAAALVSEDAATVTAASLAAASLLDVRLSFLSAVTGLWIGDLGVYALARIGRERAANFPWFSRAAHSLETTSAMAAGGWPLALSRFFPGTRVPAYLAAGLNRMPFFRYAGITAATAALWTALVFSFIWLFPSQAQTATNRFALLGTGGLTAIVALLLWKRYSTRPRTFLENVRQRIVRWEFWPAWLFYAPVAAMCAWLGIRYRGLALPTIANLNQKNGGIIGESKMEILCELMKSSPEATAMAFFVPAGSIEERLARIQNVLETHRIYFPVVLKPDTAQRGAGFRKIHSMADVKNYLLRVAQPLILQNYVEGPNEAGIFYYRFPGVAQGHLFGITRKRFPSVTGDGVHTLREFSSRACEYPTAD